MRIFLYGKGDQTKPLEENSHVLSVYQRTYRFTRYFDSKSFLRCWLFSKEMVPFDHFLPMLLCRFLLHFNISIFSIITIKKGHTNPSSHPVTET